MTLNTNEPILKSILEEECSGYSIRQKLIKEIQEITKRKLVTYIANSTHPFAIIVRDDVLALEDIFRLMEGQEQGDLLINSPGGEPNAAEKILMMFRSRFSKEFNVLVPDYAKSAATMIALGSDKIYMGYLSELGPIDPQLLMVLPNGQQQMVPARAYVDGLEDIRKRIKEGKEPAQLYYPMLSQIRPEMIRICENAIADSREFAAKWLKQYMLKGKPTKAIKIARMLSEAKAYRSHGKVINHTEAQKLGLNIELVKNDSELWHKIWELYCRSAHFLQKTGAVKLFECDANSFTIQIRVNKPTEKG